MVLICIDIQTKYIVIKKLDCLIDIHIYYTEYWRDLSNILKYDFFTSKIIISIPIMEMFARKSPARLGGSFYSTQIFVSISNTRQFFRYAFINTKNIGYLMIWQWYYSLKCILKYSYYVRVQFRTRISLTVLIMSHDINITNAFNINGSVV